MAKKASVPEVVRKIMDEAQRQSALAQSESVAVAGGDYSVDNMNQQYAVVIIGGGAVIVRENPDAQFHEKTTFLRPEAFRLLFQNRFTQHADHDGKIKTVTWAQKWLMERDRRTYDGLIFHPDPDGESAPSGYLNLWRGFSVEPRKGGSYKIFRDHLFNNVANGDEHVFRWIFGWFAQMMQKPREKPGTALVLRGAMGVGKTKVGEVFGALINDNYFSVDDPRYVTGQFNTHMAHCLLLQAEEAVWAGDKTAEGRLKGMVTSSVHLIEAKGVDQIKMPNYIRVLMTSNEDWVVPAGKDERRFCVLDVHSRCARNYDYFNEMDAELDAGGREALLYDLLHFDLSSVNLREIPKTGALLEQKIRSLDSIEMWLLDRLKAGTATRKLDHWPEFIATNDWVNDYIEASERVGIKRRAAETAFGMKIRKLLPSAEYGRATIPGHGGASTTRAYGYFLPPLSDCREAFAAILGQEIGWCDDQ